VFFGWLNRGFDLTSEVVVVVIAVEGFVDEIIGPSLIAPTEGDAFDLLHVTFREAEFYNRVFLSSSFGRGVI